MKIDSTKILVAVLAIALIVVSIMRCNDRKRFENIKLNQYLPERQMLPDSTELVTLRATLITKDQLLYSKDSALAAIKANLPDKGRTLNSYTHINTSSTGSIQVRTKDSIIYKYKDTTYHANFSTNDLLQEADTGKTIYYSNKWLTLNELLIGDTAYIDYEYRGEFEFKTFYQGKDLFVQARSLDSSSKIVNMSYFTVEPPKKKFYETTVFKLAAGVAVGIGIGVALK